MKQVVYMKWGTMDGPEWVNILLPIPRINP